MAPNKRQPNVSLPITHHRLYQDPLGPPTELVDLGAFKDEAAQALDKIKQRVQELEKVLDNSGQREQVEERCSLSATRESFSSALSTPPSRATLAEWHEDRLFAPLRSSAPANPSRGASAAVQDENSEMGDGPPSVVGSPAPAPLLVVPEEVDRAEEELKKMLQRAEASSLPILQSLDHDSFVQKTRLPDYNTLLFPRPSTPLTVPPPSTSTSDLENILITLRFHPITPPRVQLKAHLYVPAREQVLHCLGSTTLWELRCALRLGGDTIPEEVEAKQVEVVEENLQAADEEPEEEEDDEEDDEEKELPGSPGLQSKGRGVWAEDEEEGQKKRKWGKRKRRVGSVFGIEGTLYADEEEGVVNYADMIIDSVSKVTWDKPRHIRSPSTELLPLPTLDFSEPAPLPPIPSLFQPDSTAASIALNFASNPNTMHSHLSSKTAGPEDEWKAPEWTKGASMQETRLGELKLKVGMPYLFVHEGDLESVWSVEAIRARHPSDPAPPSPSTTSSPYPITVHLSRPAPHPRCCICDRDPATRVVLDQAIIGENPGWLCEGCFKELFGEDGGEGAEKVDWIWAGAEE